MSKLEIFTKRIEDIEGREEWTRNRFDEVTKQIEDIEGREGWTRKHFDEVTKRIEDIEGREGWTRNRFDEVTKRIEDIEGREGWTRNRFDEVTKRIEDIEKREEWTRRQFEELRRGQMISGTNDGFYLKKTYSQSGEDAIISYILQYLDIPFDHVSYLDLGANHAKEMSNSYFFYEQGARGVLVEANPELINELRIDRKEDVIINKAIAVGTCESEIDFYSLSGDGLSTISYESAMAACKANPDIYIKETYKIPVITIEEIFEQYFQDGNPTIMSIDLEGIEMDILRQIDFSKHRPIIIIMEDIPYSPNLILDSKENKAVEYMKENGYTEYAFTGINAIYLDKYYVETFYQTK